MTLLFIGDYCVKIVKELLKVIQEMSKVYYLYTRV